MSILLPLSMHVSFFTRYFFRITLLVDYEKCIINYVTSSDHPINYAIRLIDYVANIRPPNQLCSQLNNKMFQSSAI